MQIPLEITFRGMPHSDAVAGSGTAKLCPTYSTEFLVHFNTLIIL